MSVGALDLLRRNRSFRFLWFAQIISQAGDWFNSVALFTLLLHLAGSGAAVALTLNLRVLPTLLFGPLAGIVADRFERKTILVAADLSRALLVLALLLVRRPEQIGLVYALTALGGIGSAFFEPARSAALPQVVELGELLAANTLAAGTWSVMLAVGAALGGIAVHALGTDAAFVLDALSFVGSALCVLVVRFPPSARRSAPVSGWAELAAGLRYLRENRGVWSLLSVKGAWGLTSGGLMLLLAAFGERVFPVGRAGSLSTGLLYAACGLGAVVGSVIAQRMRLPTDRRMIRATGRAFVFGSFFGVALWLAPNLAVAALCVGGVFVGGNVLWVFSTTLLQNAVPDAFRGRVFALEMMGMTLAGIVSTTLTGWALDHGRLGPRGLAAILGGVLLLSGCVWLLRMTTRRPAASDSPQDRLL